MPSGSGPASKDGCSNSLKNSDRLPASCHIVIACSYLHVPGGYEKAVITTAGLLAGKGHRVTLLILDKTPDTYYPLHPAVKIVQAPLHFGITESGNPFLRKWWMWNDIRKLRRLIRQLRPDHFIASEYPFAVTAVLAGARKYGRVYSWEHHHHGAQVMNRFWRSMVKRTYPQLDAVICLNKDEQSHYLALNNHATVIPNFITAPLGNENPKKEFDLISVTRFNHIKGIDLLMQVAKDLLPAHPELKWKVIGYGEQEAAFLDFIRQEGLGQQLVFQAADKTDLGPDYQTAGIFVMTSRNECFPLVLLEAMSHGLPCIAFDCETGPRHIIRHDETGWLVPKENTGSMVLAIRKLALDDNQTRTRMRDHALERIKLFYPDKVYEKWLELFSRES